MNISLKKPDNLGALSSTVCLIHCLATPFLFITKGSSICCSKELPVWWTSIDYLFLAISFIAIYRSTKTTSKSIMKPLLWSSYFLLFFCIVNEKTQILPIPEYFSYISGITLAGLHIYNLKYCQCNTKQCCSSKA